MFEALGDNGWHVVKVDILQLVEGVAQDEGLDKKPSPNAEVYNYGGTKVVLNLEIIELI